MPLHVGSRAVDVDLIIFDKDGTLVDLHASWGRWFAAVAQHLAPYLPPNDLLRRFGWDAATERIRPETPMAIASLDEARAVCATFLYEHGMGWTAAIAAARAAMDAVPHIAAPPVCALQPLFARLRACACKIAVVTTDTHAGVLRDLEPVGVMQYIDAIVGSDASMPPKPAPDAVHAIAARVGVPVERVAVVGDSLADLEMGRAANVALTIGVLSGSGTRQVLAPVADVVIESVCVLASP